MALKELYELALQEIRQATEEDYQDALRRPCTGTLDQLPRDDCFPHPQVDDQVRPSLPCCFEG